jgi:hypothetical protein
VHTGFWWESHGTYARWNGNIKMDLHDIGWWAIFVFILQHKAMGEAHAVNYSES